MGDDMGSYLWTQKPSAIPPQIQALAEAETSGAFEHGYDDVSRMVRTSKGRRPAVARAGPLSQFFEDPASHWGARVDVRSLCAGRMLPLRIQEDDSSAIDSPSSLSSRRSLRPNLTSARSPAGIVSSMVVFPCSHAFHDICISEGGCIICASSTQSTNS